jgi:hypothetical protein
VRTLVAAGALVAGIAVLFLATAGGWLDAGGGRGRRKARRPVAAPPPVPVCPVGDDAREWIDRSMRWCAEQFGDEAARRVVLPTSNVIPRPYTGSEAQLRAAFLHISTLMGVDGGRISLQVRESLPPAAGQTAARAPHTVGRYRTAPVLRLAGYGVRLGRNRIEVERAQLADPERLVAVLAHELAHQRLLGEERIRHGQADHERLTDLLAVYLGFGIFAANAAVGYAGRLGYLSVQEYGYALGLYCRLRGEAELPGWARQLDPRVRVYVRQSLAFLAVGDR